MLAALPKAPSKYDPFKYPRNLSKNLEDNNHISKNNWKNLVHEIKLKKKNRNFKWSKFYTEEVRRSIKEKYGFKKLMRFIYKNSLWYKISNSSDKIF